MAAVMKTMLMKAIDALDRHFELPQVAEAAAPKRQQRWRGLRFGNLGLLVAHDSGGELLEEVRVYPLPRAPAWCAGLINLRGQLIPAFDLHELLNITQQRANRQWWLVLGRDADAVAVAIDALPASLIADEGGRIPSIAVPSELRAFAGQAYRIGSELWLEFKYREFFKSLSGAVSA
jgi:twitching motility protein PilI